MTRKLYKERVKELLDAIYTNFEAGAVLPSLILLYSTIDIMAWLNRDKNHKDNDRSDFQGWVNSYLLPESGLNCEAIDLYSARCAILHSYTSESRLSREGDARPIFYVCGGANAKDSQNVVDRANLPVTAVVIKIEDLIVALSGAVQKYDKKLSRNPKLSKLVSDRAGKFFGTISSGLLTPKRRSA